MDNDSYIGYDGFNYVKTRADNNCNNPFLVNDADLEAYIHFKKLESKDPLFCVKSVTSFPDTDNPYVYIINYSHSWEVISADKRLHPTIIECEQGQFDSNTQNRNIMAWLSVL